MHEQLVRASGQGMCVRRLGEGRAGEIRVTRFIRNPNVAPAEMVATAAGRLGVRSSGRHVLAIQDTTVIKSDGGGGLYLHVCLALDADDGAILGLADATFLKRDKVRNDARRSLPIAEKESQRWLNSANAAAKACADAREVTVIADRESDIYAAFALRPAGAHMVVRAAQDRALDDGGLLFGKLDAKRVDGRLQIDLPAKPGRSARRAMLAVRFMRV